METTAKGSTKLCVLCGINPATKGDGDHLPPKCIYPRPRPANIALNKVPACVPCNSGGSKDDEEFKVIVGLTTGEYRSDEKKLVDSLARTLGGNKRLARKTIGSARQVWAQNIESGLYSQMVKVSFDYAAYSRVIQRIVRGLYWQQTGTILGNAEIVVMHGDQPNPLLVQQIKHVLCTLDPVSLNGGAFTYKCFILEEGDSFWALQFFKKHTVFAAVAKQEAPAVRTAGS